MSSAFIPIVSPPEKKVRERCTIDIDAESLWIRFDPPLPDGPHKPTRMEVMAAAALVGIARALTGQGETEVMQAVQRFDAAAKRRKK
jgi:hypothetical protein